MGVIMKNYIKGNYRRSIYASPKGYVIGLFKIRDTDDERMKDYVGKTITFTGYFHDLNEDDTYIFYGEAMDHPRYGFQYQVSEYERIKPEDKDGVIEFLASDLFPGIGAKMAEEIVNTLGERALDRILEDESCLSLVPKLSSKKAHKIYEILNKYEESHKTIVYLTELGFNMKDALNIYNAYRTNTVTTLEHNIYSIIDDVEDVSFEKIDSMRYQLHIPDDDERRIKASIIYIMNELTFSNGDTYLWKDEIAMHAMKYLKVPLEEIPFSSYLESLVLDGKINVEEDRYYVKSIYDAENYDVNKIKKLLSKDKTEYKKLDKMLDAMQENTGIVYNEKQKMAIKKALEDNILIITGGPGTGKTTIIKAIVELYGMLENLDYDGLVEQVTLLAPTGRASKRMSESTLLPAMTIHRFLKWNKETNQFGVNEYNKDQSKLVIIDEVSMIDIALLESLMKGLTDQVKIIFVGDYNQLPSVGPGQILKDFIESHVIDTIYLDLLYRQDENSYITTLAQEIKDNNLSPNFLEKRSDYTFLECSNHSIRSNLKNLCEQFIKKGYDYKRVQILAPMYRGENGIDNLNQELQMVFNPPNEEKKEIRYGDVIFREQDKILQLVNMPDDNIFNGDIGVIKNIIDADRSESKKNEIYVDYDGNVVKYTPKDFIKIKHGFVITIHKAQGSEFEAIVMPMSSAYKRMLYRKLIYTGITRAKKKLILIGESESFLYGVENNNEYIRKTSLLEKLKKIV